MVFISLMIFMNFFLKPALKSTVYKIGQVFTFVVEPMRDLVANDDTDSAVIEGADEREREKKNGKNLR